MPKFERTVDVSAPVATVWSTLSDPSRWPAWLAGVGAIAASGGLAPGATFEWQADGKTGAATVERIDPNGGLTLLTQVGDDQDRHTFTVKPKRRLFGLLPGTGSQITYTLDTLMRRGPLGEFIAAGNPADQLRLKSSMDKLRGLLE